MDADAPTPPRTALIVEDDPYARRAMVLLLRRWGWQVMAVNSVAGAIESMKRAAPSCIILDLTLPDGNGVSILRHVRTQALPIRIAVATGTHDSALLAEVAALRPDALYHKPVDVPDMARWLATG